MKMVQQIFAGLKLGMADASWQGPFFKTFIPTVLIIHLLACLLGVSSSVEMTLWAVAAFPCLVYGGIKGQKGNLLAVPAMLVMLGLMLLVVAILVSVTPKPVYEWTFPAHGGDYHVKAIMDVEALSQPRKFSPFSHLGITSDWEPRRA